MPRKTELPNNEYVQRRLKCGRHFESNRYTAARQCQDNHIRSICVCAKLRRETTAGFTAIAKAPDHCRDRFKFFTSTVA
jgi:hypothetical protein